MRYSPYAVLAFSMVGLVVARDSFVASGGRNLLSRDNDTDPATGMLVIYWGQNSAAPPYQEPE